MITVKEMHALERWAAKKGVVPAELMENAGKAVVEKLQERYDLADFHVLLFCGGGNNGGDGFVIAHYLRALCPVVVVFVGDEGNLSDEAKEKYDRIKEDVLIVQVEQADDLRQFKQQKDLSYLLIDALLGTGVHGELREPLRSTITFFNGLRGEHVAVDVPSGLDADTGEGKLVCMADLIFALHDVKIGLASCVDKTVVVDIGIPV